MKIMRLFKTIFSIIILISLLGVLNQNMQPVSIDLFLQKFSNVPLSTVILVTLGSGIFIGYVLAISSIMGSKTEARLHKNLNKKLTDEINSLRNISINDENDFGHEDESS
tara:strand:- start:3274 stop:3603 length:330 start_codon:yes stop_codon:yes gene_type:complete